MKTLITLLALTLALPFAAFAQNGVGISVTDVSADVAGTVEVEGNADATTDTEADVSASLGDFLTNAAGVYVTTAAQVSTDDDLQIMGENLMTADEKLVSFNATKQDRITASYKHDGRLLGIFPVQVKSDTVVSRNEAGEIAISTKMPWWNFFVMGTGSIATTVDTSLTERGNVAAEMQANADASARARILEEVVSAHMAIETSAK